VRLRHSRAGIEPHGALKNAYFCSRAMALILWLLECVIEEKTLLSFYASLLAGRAIVEQETAMT